MGRRRLGRLFPVTHKRDTILPFTPDLFVTIWRSFIDLGIAKLSSTLDII